jgi:hypothetical protein
MPDEGTPEHKAHMKIIDRAIKRRLSRRPANVVDHIRVRDVVKADALLGRMGAAGLTGNPRHHFLTDDNFREIPLPVVRWQAVMAEELAAQQGITPEKFMGDILSEGLYEAFLEFNAQRREVIRIQRLTGMDDDIPF